MTTSFREMLELPNFGDMTTSTIYFESRDDATDNYDGITFISKYLYFKEGLE